MLGYKRKSGPPGIRDLIIVIYTVDCSRIVSEKIAADFKEARVIGFTGCPNSLNAYNTLYALATHPNCGAVLVVSQGCEGLTYKKLTEEISNTGREVRLLNIQDRGGTKKSIKIGKEILEGMNRKLEDTEICPISIRDLIIGIECGGSDATSGLSSNPAAGYMADMIVNKGGTIIVEELAELLGCRDILAPRGKNKRVSDLIREKIGKAESYGNQSGCFAIRPGNIEGGLTTIEEKSLGAACKLGTLGIEGVIERNEFPPKKGLYLLDTIGLDYQKWACLSQFSNDAIGNTALSASHSHIIVFTTGRGNVIGAALSPVIKVTGNPYTYKRMKDDIDINAGEIIEGNSNINKIGQLIYDKVLSVAAGEETRSEIMGHFESFINP